MFGTDRQTRGSVFWVAVALALAFGLSASLTHGVAAAADAAAPSAPRPNVIFILADDLGYTDLGCMGSKYYETPHIDRMAAQGVRFLAHHHCQNCTPTRAALMSGQYPPRTGVFTVGSLVRGNPADRKLVPPKNATELPLDRQTIADQFKAAGYATGMFGKWHIGEQGEYHPGKRGFDEAIATMGKHFDFTTRPAVDYPQGTYLADFLTDKAVDFIERHKAEPFFLYLPHFGVHSPHHAKPELIEKFRPKAAAGGHHDPVYAAMIASVDESVGRVLAKLDELKLAEKTVVIFASDNGGVGGYAEIGGKGVTNNAPLRGGKGMLYEGGVRVPFIVRWPGVAPAGTTCSEPSIHVDVYPTLLEIAAAPAPKQTLDGVSLAPLLRDPQAKLARDAIYVHFPGYLEGYATKSWRTTPVGTIQSGDWKLLEYFEDGRLELYNLADDPGEAKNLAATEPERAKALQAKLAAWRTQLSAPMPTISDGSPLPEDAEPKKKGKKQKAKAAGAAKEE